VLGVEPGDVASDLGVVPLALEKSRDSRAGIIEQGLVDEIDGRGGALDVQQDGADVAQLDAGRSGMYEGPRHSG